MRIFVTGASGHIGSALMPELVRAGHEVVGLARSDAAATALVDAGVVARRGDLSDIELLRAIAAECDAAIHLAFNHDWMRGTGSFASAAAADLAAVEALIDAFSGTGKALVGPSGTLAVAGLGRTATEDDDDVQASPRAAAPRAILEAASRGVRGSVIRTSPVVHSDLDGHGFIPSLVGIARTAGVSGYVGDGANRWPAVHTRDLARLYRLAAESAPAGSRLHGVADEGIPFLTIAEAIARHLGLPSARIVERDVERHFGPLARAVVADNPSSSARTRELLGWQPVNPGLIADLDAGHYFFAEPAAART